MLPRAPAAGLLAVVVLLPVTSAAPVFWGTEQQPELTDPPGNVQYSPLYTGPRDRDHIDLLAAWFEYDAFNDTLVSTLKVSSLEGANESTQDGWFVLYNFRGNVTVDDEIKAELSHALYRNHQSAEWRPEVNLETPGGQLDVPFTFDRVDGTPGYFRWTIPMDFLQNWGEQITNFHASGAEEQFVGSSFISTGVLNRNPADAQGSFVWKDLEPLPGRSTDEASLTPTRSETSPPSPESETVTLGLAASVAAVLVAVAFARRRW